MLAVLQGPGLSPDQLWGDLVGLAVHRLLSMYHRVTLPWRAGSDSGVKSWRPVETCQISPVKTQRCGLRRCVFLHLDMRTLCGSRPFPGSSASKEENSPEKRMRKTGEEQNLILETCQEPQIISAGYSLLSTVTSLQQRLPWFPPSSSLPGPAVIWGGFWLDPGDGGFRAWLYPETLIELPRESRVQRYPVAIAWKCQAYIS